MKLSKLSIIGVGNMGGAIASCLLDNGVVVAGDLFLYDPSDWRLEEFRERGVFVADSLGDAVERAGVVLLAVKPQVFPTLLVDLKSIINSKQLIISIAAGIKIASIKKVLGEKQPVVRVMPNLCATVEESMSVWVKSDVSKEQERFAVKLLQAVGKEAMIEDEGLMDAVTAVSGSGPAYVFYLAELLEMNARDLGLPDEVAEVLARQTVIGSAKLLEGSDKSAKELRVNVTSKGGTTEAAFKAFEEINLKAVFRNGVRAAWRRSKELSK
jgi:pyrroline-5-carboxylate reductase